MALSKLGDYIELSEERNVSMNLDVSNVRGISTHKMFIPTKANMDNVSLNGYKVVLPNYFAYVADTSRRGNKISLAFNDSETIIMVSSITTIFKIKDNKKLLSTYLFMYFNRPEFDRYSRFNSWGSAREAFSWDDMCDIDIVVPSITEQQKVVDVYLALVANQKSYETGLEDLKLTCDAYIENLRKVSKSKPIYPYLIEKNERNSNLKVETLGVSNLKKFVPAKRESENTDNYKLVNLNEFAFRPVLDKLDSSFTVALNLNRKCAVSPAYIVFNTNEDIIMPEYLLLWLSRTETERFLAFNAWGSARNTIELSDIGNLNIPIPNLEVQKSIVSVFNAYEKRKKINELLKEKISEICPILIKGSIYV